MKLLKKLFPTIFDAKNTNKVQKKKSKILQKIE